MFVNMFVVDLQGGTCSGDEITVSSMCFFLALNLDVSLQDEEHTTVLLYGRLAPVVDVAVWCFLHSWLRCSARQHHKLLTGSIVLKITQPSECHERSNLYHLHKNKKHYWVRTPEVD